jgi:hypothetical protein
VARKCTPLRVLPSSSAGKRPLGRPTISRSAHHHHAGKQAKLIGDVSSCKCTDLLKCKTELMRKNSTEHGIDRRKEDGSSCLVQKRALGSDDVVAFTVLRLSDSRKTRALGIELVNLWEVETGLDWGKEVVMRSETNLLLPTTRDSKDIQESTTAPTPTGAVDLMDVLDAQDEPWPAAFFTGRGL